MSKASRCSIYAVVGGSVVVSVCWRRNCRVVCRNLLPKEIVLPLLKNCKALIVEQLFGSVWFGLRGRGCPRLPGAAFMLWLAVVPRARETNRRLLRDESQYQY